MNMNRMKIWKLISSKLKCFIFFSIDLCIRGNHPSSLPESPLLSSDAKELAYFSDGHSPKDYEERHQTWNLQCQWKYIYKNISFRLSADVIVIREWGGEAFIY